MPRDCEKAKARRARYLERQKVKKYGPGAAGKDMRGRHGNHARGANNARWNGGRYLTSHGYVAVRVPPDHPHAWGAHDEVKYAYEHIVVMEAHLGRPLREDETVHHGPKGKRCNEIGNLAVKTRSEHAKHHSDERGRDALGRFPPRNLRVRQFPVRQEARR